MNIDQLRQDLDQDEGCIYEVYLDHLGYPTFGIGHLITYRDREYDWSVGTPAGRAGTNTGWYQHSFLLA